MAEDSLTPSSHLDGEEEEGGGPVKPFLDHLEDLRWTIIKVLSALIISMVVCLVAGNWIVALLTWPLARAQELTAVTNQTAIIRLGDATVGKLPLTGLDPSLWGGVRPRAFDVTAIAVGTNVMLGLRADTNAPSSALNPGIVTLKTYGPIGGIVVALKLALYGGLSLASPFVLLFIGQFVLPALKVREKRFLYRAVGLGTGLFLVGVSFCYYVIMQITLLATVQFSRWLGFGADEWRAEDYVDFVLKMILAVGLSFQLPVVLLTLVKVGILDYEQLAKYRPYFIVFNMVACALITPSGDPFTMLLLAIPVQGLYEVSVWIARIWWRREQRELQAQEQAA